MDMKENHDDDDDDEDDDKGGVGPVAVGQATAEEVCVRTPPRERNSADKPCVGRKTRNEKEDHIERLPCTANRMQAASERKQRESIKQRTQLHTPTQHQTHTPHTQARAIYTHA
jgi:hypothetical protein